MCETLCWDIKCQSLGNQQLWQQRSFHFLHFVKFCQSPVANMAANYICIKQKTKVYVKMRWAMVVILGIWVEQMES